MRAALPIPRRIALVGLAAGALLAAATVTASVMVTGRTPAPLGGRPATAHIPALKDALAGDFAIGAAIGPQNVTGPHADLVKKHFNSVTPTNALKWSRTEPTEGRFDFTDADAIVGFAKANGIKVRGHTLVWHQQTPPWVFRDPAGRPMTPTPANKALLLSRLEHHIRVVVGRYRGRIAAWDVVNEPLADDGSMRNSPWYQIAGLDYVADAFRTAHAADPGAEMCVNDANLTDPVRRDGMLRLVRRLRHDGVPVDCVGNQMHSTIDSPSAADTTAAIDAFAGLGVDQQITELDISVYADGTSSYADIPTGLLARQAARYQALFGAFRSRRAHISSVTLWGLADDDTWLDSYPIRRHDAPLLFDRQLRPKPAFWAVVGNRGGSTKERPS